MHYYMNNSFLIRCLQRLLCYWSHTTSMLPMCRGYSFEFYVLVQVFSIFLSLVLSSLFQSFTRLSPIILCSQLDIFINKWNLLRNNALLIFEFVPLRESWLLNARMHYERAHIHTHNAQKRNILRSWKNPPVRVSRIVN